MNKKLHVRKGDNVIVLSGKDKGKKGKVLSVIPKSGKVIVEGVAMATKHKKPRSQADVGGILHQETPIYACKVMLYCEKCKKGVRVRHMKNDAGERTRVCCKCGEIL